MKGKTKRVKLGIKLLCFFFVSLQFFVKEFCKVASLKRNSPKTVNGKDVHAFFNMTFAWEEKPTRDLCKRAS
jgi:hypothetical protein